MVDSNLDYDRKQTIIDKIVIYGSIIIFIVLVVALIIKGLVWLIL